MQVEKAYQRIVQQLDQLRMKYKVQLIFSGLTLTGTFIYLQLLLFGWLESVFWFSEFWRLVLFTFFIISSLSSIIIWMIYRIYRLLFLKNKPSDDQLAMWVGRHFPHIKDRLTNALQVFRNPQKSKYGTSIDLAEASLVETEKEVRHVDFKQSVPWSSHFQQLKFVILLWILLILMGILFYQPLARAWFRLSHPNRAFIKPLPYQLTLLPGDVQVIQGESVEITVQTKGSLPNDVVLRIEELDQPQEEKILKPPFCYRLSGIRTTMQYSAHCGEAQTPTYTIDVVQRPMIRSLQIQLFPPDYSNLPDVALNSNEGDIHALKGTRVQVHGLVNKWISKGRLVFDQQPERGLSVSKNQLSGSFIVQKEDRYQLQVVDSLGLKNTDPISYMVRIQKDLYPLSRIVFPKKSQDLDESMKVAMTLEGEDDFGISKMKLVYWVHSGGMEDVSQTPAFHPLQMDENNPKNVLLNTVWDLTDLGLFPEDMVSYELEVWDNDDVSGPKMTRSATQTLRFPSIYEIFQEVENEQARQTENLMEIYQESQSIREDIEQLSQEIKTGEEMKWEEREILDDVSKKQKKIEENLQSMVQDLEEMVDRMDQFDMLNPETLEKYQELQELYEEIGSQELFDAMKKLQDNLREIDPSNLQQAMEQLQRSQDQFVKSIERTISLLKRIQIEQKLDELIQRMDDLAKRQELLSQQMEQDGHTQIPAMQQNQKDIQKDTGNFRGEMEDFHSKMEEVDNMPLSKLDQIMAQMDKQELQKLMEQIQDAMKEGNLGQAVEKSSRAHQSMMSLSNMLKMLQKTIQQTQKEQITKGMQRIMYRLIQLSYLQESLANSLSKAEMKSREGAQKQFTLISGLAQVADSLVSLSHKTFFISPKIGVAISKANQFMRLALGGLQQAGARGVNENQNQAMGGLNQCVLAMQDAMNQMASSASGMGMEEFLMQMNQMSQQQQGINQQTMDMLNQGQLTLQEQAAMSRLMAEQTALKKALERIKEGMKNRSDIQRRLGQMAGEMEEVIKDFKNKNVQRETIRRQQRILSRMLDAQHSIQKREYSQRREARSGVDVVRQSPNGLELSDSSWKEKLRKDILHLGDEGYTEAYQKWIRQYFDALAKELEKDN